MNKKEVHRTRRIQVLFTEEEGRSIDRNAKELNLRSSEYIRKIVLDGMAGGFIFVKSQEEKSGFPAEKIIERKTLIGIANNLNQLTRFSHENQSLHPRIESLINHLEGFIER